MKKIRVAELFAGVGGFSLGLKGWKGKSASSNYTNALKSNYEVVWSNQWEPSTKRQEASEIYVKQFGQKGHSNKDISEVAINDIEDHDLLVGGFPCQDYSVATTLKNSKGLYGKKGVLWWQIYRILDEKGKERPQYLFLENVDRLLKSPSSQRGRDFAVMLASLSDLGYVVEWRVINAAEYGMPQRRRRLFFLGYHKTSAIYKEIKKIDDPFDWVVEDGVIANAFPAVPKDEKTQKEFEISGDLKDISEGFNSKTPKVSPFENSGIMIDRKIHTVKTIPDYNGPFTLLGDIILQNGKVPDEYYLDENSFEKWKKLKGAKNEVRVNKAQGFTYKYSEGAMVFPDALDKASRTIITGEGGASPSRFKHVVPTKDGRLRRLTPIELERLNMFPDDHTAGIPDVKRAFLMGNALVVGIIEGIGKALIKKIEE